MARARIDQAAEAMKGKILCGDAAAIWDGAVLDSRKVVGGELFFALPGERSDGHGHVGDALARGAAAAVVHERVALPEGATAIRVVDTLAGLHDLTRAVRSQTPKRLVAVTGSAGKTTTKELLALMLARRFKVAASPGNLNNLYGFPLALLGIPDDCEWMVAEMGMSVPGELRQISMLGLPDVALFTNVRPVHLEFFGSLERIAEAKAELLAGLSEDGVVVANADDPHVREIAASFSGRVVWYGIREEAEYRAAKIELLDKELASRFTLVAGEESLEVSLPLLGVYNVENCLAAAACAHQLGIPLVDVAAAVERFRAPAGRGLAHNLSGGTRVLDDTYNSNPDALSRALESAAGIECERRWAVLGDMLELGPGAPEFHRRAGEVAARLGYSPVVGVGELSRQLVIGAEAAGAEAVWYPNAEAASEVATRLRAGDLVLVKGSRGVGLEVVVEILISQGEAS